MKIEKFDSLESTNKYCEALDLKQVEKELQDITDKNIAECDKIYAAKEKEIMSI